MNKTLLVDRLMGKHSKEKVNYRPARDSTSVEACIECKYFTGVEIGSCSLVAGVIEGSAICDLFEIKSESSQEPQTSIVINFSPGSSLSTDTGGKDKSEN